jgi:hypothetical protein
MTETIYYPRDAIRAAGLLVANDGSLSHKRLCNELQRLTGATGSARAADGRSKGRQVSAAAHKAMQRLRREGLVQREDDRWAAIDLAELARWVAETLVTIADRRKAVADA